MRLSPRLGRRLTLLTLPLIGILTACAPQTQTPETKVTVTDTGCTAFARITFSRLHDTDDTIRQVKAYDAARDAICGIGK